MSVTDEITDEVRFEVLRRINEAQRIVITGHISPDDDSIASVISTYYAITRTLGHTDVRMVYPGVRMPRWSSFELYDRIEFTDDLESAIEDADLVIFLDGNQWHRFGLEAMEVETICIDHHHYETLEFDLNIIDPTAASTTEMIEKIFYTNGELDEMIAPILLMGILGDTGRFRFITPKNAQVLITAHRLIMESNLNVQSFLAGYHLRSLKAHPLYVKLLSRAQMIELPGWPKAMYSYLEEDEVEGVDDDPISEAAHQFVSYALQVESIDWTFVGTPRSDGSVKVSLRSLPGSVNVKDIATLMGIGGGHDRAAGGTFKKLTPAQAAAWMLEWCEAHDAPKDEQQVTTNK
ncbi:MAG: DHH family phosphoesterase [Candidatus Woesearchaeota archaeon]